MGRVMAKSKGPQDSGAGKTPTPSGSAGVRRTGWSRWRPYSAAIIGVAALFAVSALIGAHVRAGEATTVKVPNGMPSTGPSALAVPIKPEIPVTVTVYEDLRSPVSKAFAAQWQPTFHTLLISGKAQLAYRLVTQTDLTRGGHGSADAANAAGCAQDQGVKQFQDYVKELWKHQPPVSDDRFANTPYLEKLGRKVHGLQASLFVPCVQSRDHQGWVTASQKDFAKAGLGDVPVIQVNGVAVPDVQHLTPARLMELVKKATAQAIAADPGTSASPADQGAATPSTSPSPSGQPLETPSASATGQGVPQSSSSPSF
jgi:protein-disulfide isomerase